MDAKIKIDGIDMNFKTKVDYIYPFANNKSKTIDVRFVIDNKNKKTFSKYVWKSSYKK
jgi:Cu(I)/Ag(I) efflux system membrane fusion protein